MPRQQDEIVISIPSAAQLSSEDLVGSVPISAKRHVEAKRRRIRLGLAQRTAKDGPLKLIPFFSRGAKRVLKKKKVPGKVPILADTVPAARQQSKLLKLQRPWWWSVMVVA